MVTTMGLVLGGVIVMFVLFIGVLVALQWNMHAVMKTHDATLVLWPRWLMRFRVNRLIQKVEAKQWALHMDADSSVLLVRLYVHGIELGCFDTKKLHDAIVSAAELTRDIGDLVRLADAIPPWQKQGLDAIAIGWRVCRFTPGTGRLAGWENFRNRPYLMHEFRQDTASWNTFASEVSCMGRLDILKDMFHDAIPREYLQRVACNTNDPSVRLKALKLLQDWETIAKSVADIGDAAIRSMYLDALYQQDLLTPKAPLNILTREVCVPPTPGTAPPLS